MTLRRPGNVPGLVNKSAPRREIPPGGLCCPKRAMPFLDKKPTVCRAHNWFAMGEPIPHLQTERNFCPGTRPGQKWIAFHLPPAGGKLCEAFWDKLHPPREKLPTHKDNISNYRSSSIEKATDSELFRVSGFSLKTRLHSGTIYVYKRNFS